jgi:shikimate dehydrogenase
MNENKLFAIFGNPVSHSRSPLMHNHTFKELGFKGCYTRVRLEDGSKLKETFFKLRLQGANVTVPHKEAAYDACDEVRGFAKEIGVVNTLVNENGRLIGYNTDADGFLFAINAFKDIHKVLIIGAGGTAKALAKKFKSQAYDVTVLNRSKGNLAYFQAAGFKTYDWENFKTEEYDLVVNTTSAGLSDENYPAPIELLTSLLKETRYAADAIYGKLTPFLQLCEKMGITYKDGADMLLGQGVLANNYFTDSLYKLECIQEHMKQSFQY